MAPPRGSGRNPVGTHVKTGSGLVAGTLPAARRIGAEVLQVFVGNPRGWALSPGRPEVDAAFREQCAAAALRVVVHTPYLVNVGAPSSATYERSLASLAHNLRRAVEIGAEGVVVHTGSCVGMAAFAELFAHPATAGVPFVLETPGARDLGDPGTRRLRELRDAAALGRTA